MSADQPDLVWAPRLGERISECDTYPPITGRTVLVLHHSDSSPRTTPAEIDFWHRAQGWKAIGYHFVVHQLVDGTWQASYGRDLAHPAAAARGWNNVGVHICISGNYIHAEPPPEALAELGRLLCWLRVGLALALPLAGHRELPGQATECPGLAIDGARRLPEVLELPAWREVSKTRNI